MNARIVFTLFLSLFSLLSFSKKLPTTLLFVGSYTNDKPDKGISVFKFDTQTGALTKLSNSENITNPSFLTISPNGKFLYACSDTKMPKPGSISAFAIHAKTGQLTFINKQSSGGENPVYVAMDKSNRFVVTGNYSSGSVCLLSVNKDGSLNKKKELIQFKDSSINKSRQSESHIHSTYFDPECKYIFAPDLGADKIRAFNFYPNNSNHIVTNESLTVKTTPGCGPRHFVFHPNKLFGYNIEELSGMVTAYTYKDGKLDSIQHIFSYSKKRDSYGAADIHISPDGKFLYASNRFVGENSIAIFSINTLSGKLKLVGHQSTEGDHPRNFTIDPSGNFLLVANMLSNNIVIFKRDKLSGLLTKVGEETSETRPSCLQMRTF
ncbi:MAG: lactonase family protein [Bacteroidales bacterium]|nr:lactonase family protein [Bacteroidales bacterium]